jgi:hypothetical protein
LQALKVTKLSVEGFVEEKHPPLLVTGNPNSSAIDSGASWVISLKEQYYFDKHLNSLSGSVR